MAILFGLVVSSSSPAPAVTPNLPLPVDLQYWVPQKNDRFVADTKANLGYIVHDNGSYTMFRIGSGKEETVHYMGITYDASTPTTHWEVKSTTVFNNDHITFGKSGLFLRLSRDGQDTSYGIHATANIDDILASNDRYRSYGCILVSNQVLGILSSTYTLSGNKLDVVTVGGMGDEIAAK
jgi:hypothetical protein